MNKATTYNLPSVAVIGCRLVLLAIPSCSCLSGIISAITFGKAEIVTDEAEKIHGLRLICERFLPQHMDAFDQSIARSLSRTAVVRITLTEPPTGKRKQYDKEGVEMKYGRME